MRAPPDAPPAASALALLGDDLMIVFDRLAHGIDEPGVLLNIPDRIVIAHASLRLPTIAPRSPGPL
jgi:hypothetical protein